MDSLDTNRESASTLLHEVLTKDHLSSVEAGRLFGITNDYVTMLCRRKKIRGVFIGRAWYVERGSLALFLEETRRLTEERRKSRAVAIREEQLVRKPRSPFFWFGKGMLFFILTASSLVSVPTRVHAIEDPLVSGVRIIAEQVTAPFYDASPTLTPVSREANVWLALTLVSEQLSRMHELSRVRETPRFVKETRYEGRDVLAARVTALARFIVQPVDLARRTDTFAATREASALALIQQTRHSIRTAFVWSADTRARVETSPMVRDEVGQGALQSRVAAAIRFVVQPIDLAPHSETLARTRTSSALADVKRTRESFALAFVKSGEHHTMPIAAAPVRSEVGQDLLYAQAGAVMRFVVQPLDLTPRTEMFTASRQTSALRQISQSRESLKTAFEHRAEGRILTIAPIASHTTAGQDLLTAKVSAALRFVAQPLDVSPSTEKPVTAREARTTLALATPASPRVLGAATGPDLNTGGLFAAAGSLLAAAVHSFDAFYLSVANALMAESTPPVARLTFESDNVVPTAVTAIPRVAVAPTYPTYTTVVQGVSANFVSESLALMRASLLAEVSNLIAQVPRPIGTTPPSVVGAPIVTVFQPVNIVDELTDIVSISTAALTVTGSATSTFNKGISITDGCFAIGGVCITGGGSAGGSDGEVQYNNGGSFGGSSALTWDDAINRLSYTYGSTTALSGSVICLSSDCRDTWPSSGGSGGGSWSTTTSQVAGRLINYPNNVTDIVVVGSNSTTTAEFYFDPNTGATKLYTLDGLIKGVSGVLSAAVSGTDYIGSFSGSIGRLSYWTGTGSLGNVATTTFTLSGPFIVPSTLGASVGGSNSTITYTGLATTSQPASSNLLVSNGAAGVYGVATTSVTCSGNINCTGFSALGAGSTIAFTGTLGVGSGGTGATTFGTNSPLVFNGTTLVATSSRGIFDYLVATTTATSTINTLTVATSINLLGTFADTLSDLCVGITGSSALCDADDATGGGGSGVGTIATSTLEVAGQIPYFTTSSGYPARVAGVATSSLSVSGPFSTSGLGYLIGGSSPTISYYGLSTTTALTGGQLVMSNGGAGVSSVATTTASCSGTVSCTQFTIVGSAPVTITGSGGGSGNVSTSTNETAGRLAYWTTTSGSPAALGDVSTTSLSVSGPFQLPTAGSLVGGANTVLTWTGLATTSQPASSNLLVSDGGAGVYGAATSTLTCTGAVSCTSAAIIGSAVSINLAAINANSILANITGASAVPTSLATSSLFAGNNGEVLARVGGTWVGVATTTLSTITGTLAVSKGGTALTTFGGTNTILYTTAADTLSSEAAFAYSATTNSLTFDFASSTALSTSGSAWFATTGGNVGVGTTSPWAKFSINPIAADGSAPAFAIGSSSRTLFSVDNAGLVSVGDTSGSGNASFQFAGDADAWNIGYNSTDKSFNIASSTNFSSNVAFTILKGTSNYVGIGSTSPWRTLSVNGSVALNGLSAVVGTDASLCIDATTFEVTSQAGDSCAASSARFKHDIFSLPDTGLELFGTLNPVSFIYNDDPTERTYWGFIAEEAASTSPTLAHFNRDGTVQTINSTAILALSVKALKELALNLSALATSAPATTPQSSAFAEGFFTSLYTRLVTWLGDAGNGVANVFAGSLHAAETICVDDQCLTKDDVRALLQMVHGQGPAPTQGSPAEPEPPPSADTTGSPEATSTPPTSSDPAPVEPLPEEPSPEPTVTEPEPEAVPEPTPEPVPQEPPTPAEEVAVAE